MNTAKKAALIFIAILNIMNVAAGVIVQVKLLFNGDVSSILPIRNEMTVTQILLLNFIVVAAVIFLICIVLTYLVTDIAYSPLEIIKNCPQIALIPIIIILLASVVSAVKAGTAVDRLCIIASSVTYLIFNVFNFGAMVTIKEDAE